MAKAIKGNFNFGGEFDEDPGKEVFARLPANGYSISPEYLPGAALTTPVVAALLLVSVVFSTASQAMKNATLTMPTDHPPQIIVTSPVDG